MPAVTNGNLTYTLTYQNTSNYVANNVVIRDPLPPSTTFVSASNGGALVDGVVVWNIGTVNANSPKLTVSFVVHINAAPGATITNSNYTIKADGTNPVAGSPVTRAVVPPVAPPWALTDPVAPKVAPCFDCGEGALVAGSGGSGPSAGDPVNLASGYEAYEPAADLTVVNPNGPDASWQRAFRTNQALVNYGSPGLAVGWVSNYDVYFTAATGGWNALTMRYPNGGTESFTPQVNGGVPSGAFDGTPGAPFVVTGIPGTTVGTWESIVLTWKNQTQWKFKLLSGSTATYVLDQLSDEMGRAISFAWDSNRRLSTVTDVTSNGILLSLTYSGDTLSSVEDIYGRKRNYTFGIPNGGYANVELLTVSQIAPVSAVNPAPQWSYGYSVYEEQPLFASTTVPSPTGSGDATSRIYYDSEGRVAQNVDANGNSRAYTYNSGSTVVTTKDPQNNVVLSYTQKFDSKGRETGTIDAANNENFIEYTDVANAYKPTAYVDESGRCTEMTYDSFGNVLSVKSPRGIFTNYTYNYTNYAPGRLVKVQEDTKPAITMTYYEPSGRVQSVTGPHPNGTSTVPTSFTYDALGNVLEVHSPGVNGARITTFNYTQDGSYTQPAKAGQPLTITNNLGKKTHFRYDARGNVTSTWDALGNTTDITYNLADQPIDVLLPATCQTGDGRTRLNSSYQYLGGPKTSSRIYDESNILVRTVTTQYGPEGEVLSASGSTDPFSKVYDGLYRLKKLTDAAGRETTYEYDVAGNLSRVSLPGASGTAANDRLQYTQYDPTGRLLQSVDGNGVVTNYTYNDLEGLLTNIEYPAFPAQNVAYAYDSYGRLQSVTGPSGSESYGLNASDVLSSVTTTYKKADGTYLANKVISYTYNADGSRATMNTPGGGFTYGYDGVGRLTSLTNPQGDDTTWTYLDNDWLKSQTLDNGVTTNYTMNALGQTLGVTNRNSAGTILSQFGHESTGDLMLSYDGEGKLTKLRAVLANAANLSGTTLYGYNGKGELTSEASTRNGTYNNSFGYDSVGNPTTWNTNSQNFTRTFNVNNQETTGGTSQFNYDGEGNPTTYKGIGLSFDVNNKLTSFGTQLTAGYRTDGKRAWKQNASGTRTYFLYDGDTIICELDGNGSVTYTNTWGANGLVSRRDEAASATCFYTWDHQGGVAQRLDASGNVLGSYSFTAFGQKTGSGGDPYTGYNGQWGYYTDSETGLILCTNRYYDPSNGRWLTRDPIGYNGGLNLYGYVGNSPVNYVDPDGLEPLNVYGSDLDPDVSAWGKTYEVTRHSGKSLYKPSKKEFVNEMLRADAFYFWGHGYSRGRIAINDNDPKDVIDLSTIRWIARTRKKWGLPKMEYVVLDACYTASKAEYVNSWLELADSFQGSPGLTWNASKGPFGFNKRFKTSTPINYNPGKDSGKKDKMKKR